ncbi:META domain-containing protein [Billgrantia kenyensis]|uniref:META domain-containing protein n=1 Tax=Billgrantia kenyensis TaxID=321266 RepID=A0A7V9W3V0_9GAMM|nr:META domain-containing protein [Halomonas kenyensis]MBA2780556.1 META domain-containing protein [Halomonas kenyensis]MCG6663249.1 META domain-containing protein [Halomonas kenyensis]
MNKTPIGRALLLAFVAMSLAACGGKPSEPSRQDAPRIASSDHPVVGQRWNLLLVGTDERLSMPETPHFVVAPDGRVTGSDGCNQINGRVRLDEGNRIQFSDLATTRRGCPQLEDAQRVTDMMETAYRFLIDHDRLVFFGPDQRVLGGWRKAN